MTILSRDMKGFAGRAGESYLHVCACPEARYTLRQMIFYLGKTTAVIATIVNNTLQRGKIRHG